MHPSPPVVIFKHGSCKSFTAPDSGKIGESGIASPHKRNPGYKTSYDKDGGPFPDFFPPGIPFMRLACQSRGGNDSRRQHHRYRRCVWLLGGRGRRIIFMMVTWAHNVLQWEDFSLCDASKEIGNKRPVQGTAEEVRPDAWMRVYLHRVIWIELASWRINMRIGPMIKQSTKSCIDVWLVLFIPSMNLRT